MTKLVDKTDKELVADVRMLVSDLSRMGQELARRGIEFDIFTFQGGLVEARNFERVKREVL